MKRPLSQSLINIWPGPKFGDACHSLSSISPVDYNPYSPSCTINPCLQWVAGYVDNNPLAQYAACTSLFGSPAVETSTPSVDVVLSTATTTVPYIDIVVTVTTTISTFPETVVSYTTVNEITTAFTTTLVSTVTQTTAAPTYVLVKKDVEKRMKRRRGACKPRSSTALSSVPTEAPSSSESATLSLPPSVSACPNLEEYMSACACIDAVSTTKTVTGLAPVSTSIVQETVSSAIPSLPESVVTVAVTTIIYQPVTTTRTSTLATAATAATTTTTTTTPIAPLQTAGIFFADGPWAGKPLVVVGSYVQWASSGAGSKFVVAIDGAQPWLPGNPTVKMFLHSASSTVGVMYFETDAQAVASGDRAASCSVNRANGYLSCVSSTGQHSAVLQCGAYVYLASPTFSQASCNKVNLKLSPWLA